MSVTENQKIRRDDAERTAERARTLGHDVSQEVEDVLARSMRAAAVSLSTLTEVGQKLSHEMATLYVAGAKQRLRLYADFQETMLDAVQASMGPSAVSAPLVAGFERLVNGGTRAYGRFTETMQSTTEERVDRIKEAVDVMADQVKGSMADLATPSDDGNQNRARTPATKA
ncbi:MAG: hypothetical protein QOG45_1132 [Chloroflexota bacterium]|nr:hypothetical protein [Chloroflexota bacterium]